MTATPIVCPMFGDPIMFPLCPIDMSDCTRDRGCSWYPGVAS